MPCMVLCQVRSKQGRIDRKLLLQSRADFDGAYGCSAVLDLILRMFDHSTAKAGHDLAMLPSDLHAEIRESACRLLAAQLNRAVAIQVREVIENALDSLRLRLSIVSQAAMDRLAAMRAFRLARFGRESIDANIR